MTTKAKAGAVFTIMAAAMGGVAWGWLGGTVGDRDGERALLRTVFVGLSVVTTPHMVLVAATLGQKGKNGGGEEGRHVRRRCALGTGLFGYDSMLKDM